MSTTEAEKNYELAAEAWGLIADVMHSNRPKFMALCREFDLFPPQMLVLKSLDEPKPMGEVASWLACDTSNLTGIIDRLEQRELVKRTPDPKDRRVKLLVLTKEGRRLHKEISARMSQPPEEIAALSTSDLRELREIMRRANENRA
jgi:MarR family transcriptional regulator, organic hydroperoxide resistance regulator